ncbi:MAG: hypothetical protein JXR37_08740 [Kiritimatiellae bacterium]|nr:hypothetical protein [Kiritimatiellia bacterium]
MPADYDGHDGADIALYNPADGKWYVDTQLYSLTFVSEYGTPHLSGAVPVFGKYRAGVVVQWNADSPKELGPGHLAWPTPAQGSVAMTSDKTVQIDWREEIAFTAYNDLSWACGQLAQNITHYTTGSAAGPLVDYDTGRTLDVHLLVTGGSWNGGSHTLQGANGTAGTDAAEEFGGKVDCTGVISYSAEPVVLTFSGLDPASSYELTVFGNRNETSYTDRLTRYVVNGAADFLNHGSIGAESSGLSDPGLTAVAGANTAAGHVARFRNVRPGADGTITLCAAPDGDLNKPYINATKLQLETDTDNDGMPDAWEEKYGLNKHDASDAGLDADGDGVTNGLEFHDGTDPNNTDSDHDGMVDGWEKAHNRNPRKDDAAVDTDGDGLADGTEHDSGTDPDNDSDPAESDKITIELTTGDTSGTKSETYTLKAGSGSRVTGGEGSTTTEPKKFVRGRQYDVTLMHVRSTKPKGEEDYDYVAQVGGKRTGAPAKGWFCGPNFCVNDEEGLLGDYDPDTPNPTANTFGGKKAILYVGIVDMNAPRVFCWNDSTARSQIVVKLCSLAGSGGLVGDLTVRILDEAGTHVRNVRLWEHVQDDTYSCEWDGCDDEEHRVSYGHYVIRADWDIGTGVFSAEAPITVFKVDTRFEAKDAWQTLELIPKGIDAVDEEQWDGGGPIPIRFRIFGRHYIDLIYQRGFGHEFWLQVTPQDTPIEKVQCDAEFKAVALGKLSGEGSSAGTKLRVVWGVSEYVFAPGADPKKEEVFSEQRLYEFTTGDAEKSVNGNPEGTKGGLQLKVGENAEGEPWGFNRRYILWLRGDGEVSVRGTSHEGEVDTMSAGGWGVGFSEYRITNFKAIQ